MELDMYAYTAPKEMLEGKEVDVNDLLFQDGSAKPEVNSEFFYWCKFDALHNFMWQLYQMKGGEDEAFNCNTVVLNSGDIDTLEKALFNGQLEPIEEFFFGEPSTYPEDKEELKDFIEKCRNAFKDGLAVIYDSWW